MTTEAALVLYHAAMYDDLVLALVAHAGAGRDGRHDDEGQATPPAYDATAGQGGRSE